MAGLSDFGSDKVLDSWFRTLAAYKPAAIYIGLFTVVPSDSGGGTEVSTGNYARQQVTQADAQWNAPAAASPGRKISNVNDIAWTGVTWSGTVVAWGIFDQSATGNLLAWFDCADQVVASGNNVKFTGGNPGAMVISVD
jgi:hypothetical protein